MQLQGLFSLILLFLICTIRGIKEKVSLTVEGGISLVGPHCPGTVKLFCEGMDLYNLGWTYNGDVPILPRFETDYKATSIHNISSNPAFVSVSITNIFATDSGMQTANFSSVLTVKLLELNKQKINNISCGDISDQDTEQVDIVDYFSPNLTLSYQFGKLNRIEVHLHSLCHESSFNYKVKLSASDDTLQKKNCTRVSCTITFTKFFSIKDDLYSLVVVASNDSNVFLKTFNLTIASYVEQYILWTVNSTNCQQYLIQCTTLQNLTHTSMCGIRYSTENDFATNKSIPINSQYYLPRINPGSGQYFKFSAMLNDYIRITEDIKIEPFVIEEKTVIILTAASVFLTVALIHLLLLIIGAFCKATFLTSKKIVHISLAMILFALVFACAALLFTFGITVNDNCNLDQKSRQNIILNILIAVVCLGIIFVAITWTFTSHELYKHSRKRKFEGACHTMNETTNPKCTDSATIIRPNLVESMSMSNQYYYPTHTEMLRHSNRRNCHELLPYDMLAYSNGSAYPSPEYAKLNIETMDGSDHYMTKMRPKPELHVSYAKVNKKPKEARAIPDTVSDQSNQNNKSNYDGFSESRILDNLFHHDTSRSDDSFYKSVDLSEVDFQHQPGEKPKVPPLPPRRKLVHESKKGSTIQESTFISQQQPDTDYPQHQLKSGDRPRLVPIPARHTQMMEWKQLEPIEEESNK